MKRTLIALIVSILFLSACQAASTPLSSLDELGQQVEVTGGSYTEISIDELQVMLESKDFAFVNVHTPFEGDIPNTDLSIPFNEIEQNLDKLPAGTDAKIVLYCRSDRMSTIASETLVKLGYTNVHNVVGGMVAWEQAGLPIEGK